MPGIDSNTQLLLHCDGADASTTFLDSSLTPKTVTAVNSAQVDTAQTKFGTGSLMLDSATSDHLTSADNAAYELGSANFTIDMWVRFATIQAGTSMFVSKYTTTGNQRSWFWGYNGTTVSMDFRYSTDGTGATTLTQPWSPSIDTWYHIAIVRSSTSVFMFVDGTQIGSTDSISGTLFNGTAVLLVGDFNTGGAGPFDGWFDEIRLSNTARWTANFTPPTDAYAVATIASPFLSERRTPRRRMIQRI